MIQKPAYEKMGQHLKAINSKQKWVRGARLLFILTNMWIISGCIPKVNIPPIDSFKIKSSMHSGSIDADAHSEQLLSDLYVLMKANEGVKIPICQASRESKQCIKNGVTVFVQGGIIPGVGKRKSYIFRNISLDKNKLDFTKDNSGTTFIGTPVFCKDNICQVYARNGGLQVEMSKYYGNWAVIGNMTMAEGWAIDYIDFEKGIVGLQLELNILGPLTFGGVSKYALLKFPNVPDILFQSDSKYDVLEKGENGIQSSQ